MLWLLDEFGDRLPEVLEEGSKWPMAKGEFGKLFAEAVEECDQGVACVFGSSFVAVAQKQV